MSRLLRAEAYSTVFKVDVVNSEVLRAEFLSYHQVSASKCQRQLVNEHRE